MMMVLTLLLLMLLLMLMLMLMLLLQILHPKPPAMIKRGSFSSLRKEDCLVELLSILKQSNGRDLLQRHPPPANPAEQLQHAHAMACRRMRHENCLLRAMR